MNRALILVFGSFVTLNATGAVKTDINRQAKQLNTPDQLPILSQAQEQACLDANKTIATCRKEAWEKMQARKNARRTSSTQSMSSTVPQSSSQQTQPSQQ